MRPNISRRSLLGLLTAAIISHGCATTETITTATPFIHATDLYRPHLDPDDHWDLACVYALAYDKSIDLKGIVLDYPAKHRGIVKKQRNPDIAAVAQFDYITGLHVPAAIGSPHAFKSRDDIQPYAKPSDHNGANLVLSILRESRVPVAISIAGSCCDVALAGEKDPKLFADKCAGIYMNAGLGTRNPELAAAGEWNEKLDPFAYTAVFDLPCPVYWMPCNEVRRVDGMEYATKYTFRQGDVLPHLSNRVQNYFAYMFGQYKDHNWLRYLIGEKDQKVLDAQQEKNRSMYCLGGFLHAAGKTVTIDGDIVDIDKAQESAVYTFDPVRVTCDENNITRWQHDKTSKSQFIFHIKNVAKYPSAMTQAMKSLLMKLP